MWNPIKVTISNEEGVTVARDIENNEIVAQGSKNYVLYCLKYKDSNGNLIYKIMKNEV